MYRLDNRFMQNPFTVTVVGCGGTGGFVAEGLARLLPRHASLMLVDPDRVEERNLGRQAFGREDLGRFKSEALALGLARRHGRPVAYVTLPVALVAPRAPGLVIGCVDNGPARADIARAMEAARDPFSYGQGHARLWWLDAGNGPEFGQVLVGNVTVQDLAGAFDPEQEVCHALPLPTLVRPELFRSETESRTRDERDLRLVQRRPVRDCAGAVAAQEQGPTINQFVAALALEAVRRIIEGTPAWWQAYLDVATGSLSTVFPTPEGVSKLTGIPMKKLTGRR